MDWKNKLDECCADEVEEMIINYIKAGFLSDEEIEEDCEEYIEDYYPDDVDNMEDIDFLDIIAVLRKKFQNTGTQENFLKLDFAFKNMEKRGIVAEHCAGYTLSDGIEDCNETAAIREKEGEKVIGYCFYHMQDLEHIIQMEHEKLYLGFGNYSEELTAEEVGKIIVEELEKVGFSTKWNGTANERVAIINMVWDKQYKG